MKISTKLFVSLGLICTTSLAGADVMQAWNCKLLDGKTFEQLEASSEAWLAAVKKLPGHENAEAWHILPVVADVNDRHFRFVTTVPDFESWGKGTDAYPNSETAEADEAWGEFATCEGSSLWYLNKIE